MKKIIALALMVIMVTAILLGCQKSVQTSKANTSIEEKDINNDFQDNSELNDFINESDVSFNDLDNVTLE